MSPTSPRPSLDDRLDNNDGCGRSAVTAGPGVRRVPSSELFGGATELVIVHGQREYRLRVTSNGKLILTA
jgi:hemin uptake protein HemP